MILTFYFILTCQVCCSSSSIASWRPPLYLAQFRTYDHDIFSAWVPWCNKMILTFYFILTCQVCCSSSNIFWDEITSLCLKVSHPPDAFRKHLTSCCSTPSNMSANWLHLSVDEKYEKIGVKKTSVFEQFMIFLADAFRKQLTSCSSTLQNEKIHIPYVSS